METILKSPYVYIAGPFFNPEQLAIIEDIKKVLQFSGLEYFSPKDECMYEPGVTTPEQVLDINVRALEQTDLTICVTDGRDPGTMFEAGWCYAKSIPIIYLWLGGLMKIEALAQVRQPLARGWKRLTGARGQSGNQ